MPKNLIQFQSGNSTGSHRLRVWSHQTHHQTHLLKFSSAWWLVPLTISSQLGFPTAPSSASINRLRAHRTQGYAKVHWVHTLAKDTVTNWHRRKRCRGQNVETHGALCAIQPGGAASQHLHLCSNQWLSAPSEHLHTNVWAHHTDVTDDTHHWPL